MKLNLKKGPTEVTCQRSCGHGLSAPWWSNEKELAAWLKSLCLKLLSVAVLTDDAGKVLLDRVVEDHSETRVNG